MDIQTLKKKLKIPVIAAPMFLVSGVELVVAACQQGIVGSFPSLNGKTAADFEQMLLEIKQRLSQFQHETGEEPAPFAVNLIVNKTNPRLRADLALCMQHKVPIVITSLGAVKEVVDAVHSYGGLVFHDVIKKRHAEKAAEAGVDGIICVSAGAGGHAGTIHPFVLLQEIRSVYDGALILSGCINNGSAILAAEILGADFAYMGTRFIASKESMASEAYKTMLLNAQAEDIIYTDAVSGVHANFMKQSIQNAGIDLQEKGLEDFSKLHHEAKAWKDVWSAGQGVSGIQNIQSAAAIISDLKTEYQQAISAIKKLH